MIIDRLLGLVTRIVCSCETVVARIERIEADLAVHKERLNELTRKADMLEENYR